MAEQQSESRDSSTPEPEAAHKLSASEKIFVRLSFWLTILSVVGLFIAVLALYAALTESEAIRRQTSAAVWPFIQVTVADFDTGEDAGFSLTFTNSGVGPALIREVKVEIDGMPVLDWGQAVAILGGKLDASVGRQTVRGRVLSPEQQVDLLTVTDPVLARQFQNQVLNPRTSITFCYCSIFDDCWLANSQTQMLDPEPVNACPDFGDDAFRN